MKNNEITNKKLLGKIKILQDWIREHGKQHDICTFMILDKELCDDCGCKRKDHGE